MSQIGTIPKKCLRIKSNASHVGLLASAAPWQLLVTAILPIDARSVCWSFRSVNVGRMIAACCYLVRHRLHAETFLKFVVELPSSEAFVAVGDPCSLATSSVSRSRFLLADVVFISAHGWPEPLTSEMGRSGWREAARCDEPRRARTYRPCYVASIFVCCP